MIPVHYQGAPAKMDEILRIARAHRLLVIEDCAQALGGMYRGRPLGTLGDIAITSFQTHKMLTAGEGGMLFTDDEELFVRAVRFHDLGNVRPFFEEKLRNKALAARELMFAGLQLRMSELQARFSVRSSAGWTRSLPPAAARTDSCASMWRATPILPSALPRATAAWRSSC